jgi:hypothetical protein
MIATALDQFAGARFGDSKIDSNAADPTRIPCNARASKTD